jgi:hypothetical protein
MSIMRSTRFVCYLRGFCVSRWDGWRYRFRKGWSSARDQGLDFMSREVMRSAFSLTDRVMLKYNSLSIAYPRKSNRRNKISSSGISCEFVE